MGGKGGNGDGWVGLSYVDGGLAAADVSKVLVCETVFLSTYVGDGRCMPRDGMVQEVDQATCFLSVVPLAGSQAKLSKVQVPSLVWAHECTLLF